MEQIGGSLGVTPTTQSVDDQGEMNELLADAMTEVAMSIIGSQIMQIMNATSPS